MTPPRRLPGLPDAAALTDRFGRRVRYLRVSITDRCNLRCRYCMPQGMEYLPRKEILAYEEILRLLRVFVRLGVDRIRITGGEPLVRARASALVRGVAAMGGVRDLSLSTNGLLLADHAAELREAGLHRVNVSLDSLDPARFRHITQGGDLARVIAGIDAALAAGLHPVKVNVVAARGFNEDEIPAFARLTLGREVVVRFIEIMPLGGSREFQDERFIAASEIIERVLDVGALVPCDDVPGSGPARYWKFEGAAGRVGFVTPMSDSFCEGCNRIRLTSVGRLRLCLFGDHEVDLRTPMRGGASDDRISRLILHGMAIKPESHRLVRGGPGSGLQALSRVGG